MPCPGSPGWPRPGPGPRRGRVRGPPGSPVPRRVEQIDVQGVVGRGVDGVVEVDGGVGQGEPSLGPLAAARSRRASSSGRCTWRVLSFGSRRRTGSARSGGGRRTPRSSPSRRWPPRGGSSGGWWRRRRGPPPRRSGSRRSCRASARSFSSSATSAGAGNWSSAPKSPSSGHERSSARSADRAHLERRTLGGRRPARRPRSSRRRRRGAGCRRPGRTGGRPSSSRWWPPCRWTVGSDVRWRPPRRRRPPSARRAPRPGPGRWRRRRRAGPGGLAPVEVGADGQVAVGGELPGDLLGLLVVARACGGSPPPRRPAAGRGVGPDRPRCRHRRRP